MIANWMIFVLPAFLVFGAVLIILADAFLKESARKTYPFALLILVSTMLGSLYLWNHHGTAFGGMLVQDTFSLMSTFLFSLAALVAVLISDGTPHANSQFHCLVLLSVFGMILLTSGGHFLVLFIGLEVLSLSVYVLASFAKRDPLSGESGLKYFLLGSFASAFFLYGAAFVYGATGTLQLNGIAAAIAQTGFAGRNLLFLGVIFLLVGYGFKISLAPFHMWTPDVYEGAPTPVTAFMSATVKAAALASLIRVLLVAFPGIADFWKPILVVLAVLTMIAGNLTAIWQDNVKRLLAYSSIAHAGYMLVGLLAEPAQLQQNILYYIAAYVFMNLGAFAIVSSVERSDGITQVDQYKGLGYSRPGLATLMTLFLMSLGGLPPTAGFFAKFYLFRAVMDSGYTWLVVVAVLNSAISFYYYLRIVISMFTPDKEPAPSAASSISISLLVILVVTAFGTIALGLLPNFFLEIARAIAIGS